MNDQINEIKGKYTRKGIEIAAEIKSVEKEIERYCEQKKDTFINKRNKKLNYGLISYRLTEKVVCNSVDSAIKALKTMNLDFCLRIKEEIDKEKVKELDSNILAKIGIKVEKSDKLSIEPNIVEIAATIN